MSERQIKLTTCPRDCPDACAISAYVTAGKVVALTGNKDNEITHSFLCRKAMGMLQRVYSPERILKPLLKVNGAWHEVQWNKALDLIADRIRQAVREYGSLSILHYQSAGSLGALKMLNRRFFNLLGGVTEASGSLCGGAGIAGQIMDFGYRTCHDPLDLISSKLIILWGRNPSETNLHLMPILKEAQSWGTKVILIDPVKTDTSKFCDRQIKPKPGMDGYLAIGMAKVIIEGDKEARMFISDHCDNFEAYKAILDSLTLDEISMACGVSKEEIAELATIYAESKPAAIVLGWGLQRYEWGAETFRLIDALAAITGNLGVRGGGVNHGRDELEYFDQSIKGKEFAKHSRKVLKPLIGQALPELNDPPIKMAFVNGANPVNQNPDTKAVKKAFEGIDFVVVFEQFLTDTAETADIVLPVTTFLEETDVVGSYWHSYIGLVNPVIKPQGETRSDLEIYQALSERLGFGAQMEGTPENWIRKVILPLDKAGITLDSLRKGPARNPYIKNVPFAEGVFMTESGRFNLITEFSRPTLRSDEYPLILLSTHSRQWMHSQLQTAEHQSEPVAKVHPVTAAKYNIDDGELAKIVSPAGELSAVIKYDEAVAEDIISIKQGRWARFNQSTNQLTAPIISREGSNACYYQTTVRLQKI